MHYVGCVYYMSHCNVTARALVDYAHISTHYSICLFLSTSPIILFKGPIILNYANWIS